MFRLFHLPISFLTSSSFPIKLMFVISFVFTEKCMPSTLKDPGSHIKFLSLIYLTLEFLLLPIHAIWVLSLFTLSPEILEKVSSSFIDSVNDSSDPSRNSVVSSAKSDRSTSLSLNVMPLIFFIISNH